MRLCRYQIESLNQKFAKAWTPCGLKCLPCVSTPALSDRLWLFRWQTTDQALATKFKQELASQMKGLGPSIGTPNFFAKRQANLPQPLVYPRVGTWPKYARGSSLSLGGLKDCHP